MNRIVRENYPVSNLPEDLRVGLEPSSVVTVIVEEEEKPPEKVMTLEEIFALRTPPFRSKEEIDADLRRQRVEGDDSIAQPIGKLLDLLRGHPGVAVTSELTLAEVLPKAMVPRRRSYLNLLIWSGIFDLRPVTRDILIETAEYRRKARARDVALPKLPDSIHIVTAIQCQCHTILS